jgi:hypothetical protein
MAPVEQHQFTGKRLYRRWRGRASLCGGAVMMIAMLGAVCAAIPNPQAVALERAGIKALESSDYMSAEEDFLGVLRREPAATDPRWGLACAFASMGHYSPAALELTKGLENGLVPGFISSCPHGPVLERLFLVAKLGPADAFAVPRVTGAERYERRLTSEPPGGTRNEALRLLVGSCLAYRAALDGLGWYFAANAVETRSVDASLIQMFLACVGRNVLRHLGCAQHPSFARCVINDRARAAYLADRAYIYPETDPAAFVGAS